MKFKEVTISEEERKNLLENAKEAQKKAYSPYTKVSFGAAVLTTKGNYYQGCNTESVISGLGVCSERSAINNAVAHGEYNIKAVAVVAPTEEPVSCCGACLQVISEFAQISKYDIKILLFGQNGKVKETSIQKILPGMWGPRDMGSDLSKYEE